MYLLNNSSTDSSLKNNNYININNSRNKENNNNFQILFKSFSKETKNPQKNDLIKSRFNKRSKSVLIRRKNYLYKKENEIKYKNKNIPYFRKIYSNEYIKFENEITKIPHYIKKYKEDDITFTKNKILPEIKWQDFDNDVLTSEEQKKGAIKRELKALGETITVSMDIVPSQRKEYA